MHSLLDGIPKGVFGYHRLPPLQVLMASRELGGYAFTSSSEGKGFHLHRLFSCLTVRCLRDAFVGLLAVPLRHQTHMSALGWIYTNIVIQFFYVSRQSPYKTGFWQTGRTGTSSLGA